MPLSVYILSGLLVAASLWIAWQDFRQREVSILSLLFFSALILANSFLQQTIDQLIINAGVSLLFLFLQALVVLVFYLYKKRSSEKTLAFSDLLGGADIWLLLAFSLAFSWVLFIFFITFSTIMSLLFFLLLKTLKKNNGEQIPLAGYLAVFYSILLVILQLLHRSLYDLFLY